MPAVRQTAIASGLALGVFLIIRAVAEPFVIDLSDPATYRNDWGGPSLLGVLLVHCGPGVVAAVASRPLWFVAARPGGPQLMLLTSPGEGCSRLNVTGLRTGASCCGLAGSCPVQQAGS
jgi:hypothetical protein